MAEERVIRIDLKKRRRLLEQLGGNRVNLCYQCGACAGDCPSARFHEEFNPREVMMTALTGGLDTLLAPDSIIWKCSNCYNCYERCPQDVRPVEVILALKNLAQEDHTQPEVVEGTVETIRKTGRSAPVISTLARKRESMGLPPLPKIDMEEIHAILEPDDQEPSAERSRPHSPDSPDSLGAPKRPGSLGAPKRPNSPGAPKGPNSPGTPMRPDSLGAPKRPNSLGTPKRPGNADRPQRPHQPEQVDQEGGGA